jgi:hypothetical protein
MKRIAGKRSLASFYLWCAYGNLFLAKTLTCADYSDCWWQRGCSHQEICCLRKDISLDGCLEVEPRRTGIALVEAICESGGETFWLMWSWLELQRQCYIQNFPDICLTTEERKVLGWHNSLPICRTKGFPESVLVVSFKLILWCGRRGIESSNPHEFVCSQRNEVR